MLLQRLMDQSRLPLSALQTRHLALEQGAIFWRDYWPAIATGGIAVAIGPFHLRIAGWRIRPLFTCIFGDDPHAGPRTATRRTPAH